MTAGKIKECAGYSFDLAKALRHVKPFAVAVFNWQLNYYGTLPEFNPDWSMAILEETTTIIMNAIPRGTQSLLPADKTRIKNEIQKTLANHVLAIQSKRRKAVDDALAIKTSTPKQLRERYFALFPGTVVLDICWAASQHYSEWKRWLREALKPDSVPDRAFRAILTSGKKPSDYRNMPRTRGWK